MSLWNILKNCFFILLLLHIAPPLVESISKQYKHYITPHDQVGVISIKGILYASSHYNKHLTAFFKDTTIKAILLKIECPGGASGTSQALFNEIVTLKKEYPKPVITIIENVCASGGYYIASSSDYIIASGTAIIGSIGTYMPAFQLKEFIEQFKIHYEAVKSGTYKTVTDPLTTRTPEEKALLQELSADAYQQFIDDVAHQRKLSIMMSSDWADRKIFTGQQALKLGLIDQTGSTQTAVTILKEKALIEGEIEWVHPPAAGGLMGLLTSDDDDDESMLNMCLKHACSFFEKRYLCYGVY